MLHDQGGRLGMRETRARQLQVGIQPEHPANSLCHPGPLKEGSQSVATLHECTIDTCIQNSDMPCRLEAAAPTQHGDSDAIACDPTRPEECLTYCYVMDDGSMVRSQGLQPPFPEALIMTSQARSMWLAFAEICLFGVQPVMHYLVSSATLEKLHSICLDCCRLSGKLTDEASVRCCLKP